jgi:drug/metabolite transporter (DMT)-like permease
VRLPRRTKLALMGMGALLALNWVLFFTALQLTDVAVAVLLGYCGPVFVTAFGPLVTREPFDRRVIAPLSLALLGTALIVGPQQLQFAGGTRLLGAALAFCSAITYSILVLNAKRLIRNVPMSVYMLAEDTTAALVLLPFVLFAKGPHRAIEWGSLAVLGIVHTAMTGFLFLSGLRAVRTDHAAILTYAEPVSAVVFATIFLSEPLAWTTLAGGLAVVLGGVLVARMEPVAGIEAPVPVMDTDAV